jgi:glycoprotein-N-acetylgalactosamine 3-beta-galactosyltransferase
MQWIRRSILLLLCLCFAFECCHIWTIKTDLGITVIADLAPSRLTTTTSADQQSTSLTMTTTTTKYIVCDAFYASGSLGYVADPKAMSQHRQYFIERTNASFLELILQYQVDSAVVLNNASSLSQVCSQPAGVLDEAPEGVELLTRKIKIAPDARSTSHSRLLCAIYTHAPMRPLARMAALTWGYMCDGFLGFSTETIPELGLLHLKHAGNESYQNMWQKVRSLWAYIRLHYADDYDYFHLGGDDMYVLVENLRVFLDKLPSDHRPLHLGQWVRQMHHPYVAGGPGYTLNRPALLALVDQALPTCKPHVMASYEDKLVSQCLQQISIFPYDTRDVQTGQQRYHDGQPSTIYKSRPKSGKGASFHARNQAYFESLPHPRNQSISAVGPQYGLDAAAAYSVSFHTIHNAVYMGRVHAILHQTCPADSELARSLKEYNV